MNNKILILGLAIISSMLNSQVLIITHSYNRPDFIEIQHKTFKAFVKDDYKFVVFNDAPGDEMCANITKTCAKLDIECIRVPQEIHTRPYLSRASYEDFNHSCCRCANVVQYSLDILGFKHNNVVVIIDSDMFLIQDFSFVEYMQKYDIAGAGQGRNTIKYLWNGLVFFNMKTLPDKETINFNCGTINGTPVDVGGYLHYYLQEHPQLRVNHFIQHYIDDIASACACATEKECAHPFNMKNFKNLNSKITDFFVNKHNNTDRYAMELYVNGAFLHYRSATNWDQKSAEYHARKTAVFNRFLDYILQ